MADNLEVRFLLRSIDNFDCNFHHIVFISIIVP